MKRIYTFGDGKAEGKADMRNLLGGKGANLAEMNLLGMPVPPGFTITTEVCNLYTLEGRDAVVKLIQKDVEAAVAHVESLNREKFNGSGKSVGASIPDTEHAHRHGHEHLQDGSAVQNPLGVGHLGEAHEHDDPHEGDLDAQREPDVRLDVGPEHHTEDRREQGGQAGDPQREVDPVVPADTGTPLVAQSIAHPVVDAALGVVGGAELAPPCRRAEGR